MTHYFKNGNNINVEPNDALEVLDHLPPGTYTVKMNPLTERLFLQTASDFTMPNKVYGNPAARVERIKNTFNSRPRSTGVLLTGDKGSGKTLLSKALSISLIEDGVPTIVVNEPWCGQEFNSLIGNIRQPALIIFDEFEKVYDEKEQKELLTLLDGTVETKKLFVLTTNDGEIDKHLLNRPGRIYYKFEYEGIDETFVREYLNDVLVNKSHIEEFVKISNTFSSFTFDMLQALVEEMNRYNESPHKAIQDLNVDLGSEQVSYDVRMLYDGQEVDNNFYPNTLNTNPLFSRSPFNIEVYFDDNKTLVDKHESTFPNIVLSRDTLKSVNTGGVMFFEFEHKEKNKIKKVVFVVERYKNSRYNWNAV